MPNIYRKKDYERTTVERLLHSPGHPTSALKEWQRENPDTIVEIDGERIGVEVTKIVPETPSQRLPPQMWSREAKRIVSKVQRAFQAQHPEPLNIRIGFRPEWEPERESSALVSELVEMIETNVRNLDERDPEGPALTRVHPHEAAGCWLYIDRTKFDALRE